MLKVSIIASEYESAAKLGSHLEERLQIRIGPYGQAIAIASEVGDNAMYRGSKPRTRRDTAFGARRLCRTKSCTMGPRPLRRKVIRDTAHPPLAEMEKSPMATDST